MTSETPTPLPVSWPDLRRALRVDGSWRDLIVRSNDDRDWQAAIDFTRRLVADGAARAETEPDALPSDVAEIFELKLTTNAWMRLFVGPIQINCHFFGDPIEFDIDPAEAQTPEGAQALIRFVEGLAHAVDMPVHITEENMVDWVWLTYDPAARTWEKGTMFETDLGLTADRRGGLVRRAIARLRGT